MKIAVVNSGSSSIKFKLFDMNNESIIFQIHLQEISSHHEALLKILDKLQALNIDLQMIDAIGHRVVHGGELFCEATFIDENVIKKIDSLSTLAPLHNPANLDGILVFKNLAPNLKQYAIFDTAFHSTMPKEAYLYALPLELYEQNAVRRYGFHGTSHFYVAKECASLLDKNLKDLNIISLHLGNGASVCAIKNGQSIDTSMGFTPLEGLMMGTRSGDIDGAIIPYLMKSLSKSEDEINSILNKKSGLLGICGLSDVREILERNDENDKLALQMMIRRIRKYIGAYSTLFESLDAIVFTGGIGENSSFIRDEVMRGLNITQVLVIKTNEELEIARQVLSQKN